MLEKADLAPLCAGSGLHAITRPCWLAAWRTGCSRFLAASTCGIRPRGSQSHPLSRLQTCGPNCRIPGASWNSAAWKRSTAEATKHYLCTPRDEPPEPACTQSRGYAAWRTCSSRCRLRAAASACGIPRAPPPLRTASSPEQHALPAPPALSGSEWVSCHSHGQLPDATPTPVWSSCRRWWTARSRSWR